MSDQEQVAVFVDTYLELRRSINPGVGTDSREIAQKATRQLGSTVTIQSVNQVLRALEQSGRIRIAEPMQEALAVTFP